MGTKLNIKQPSTIGGNALCFLVLTSEAEVIGLCLSVKCKGANSFRRPQRILEHKKVYHFCYFCTKYLILCHFCQIYMKTSIH